MPDMQKCPKMSKMSNVDLRWGGSGVVAPQATLGRGADSNGPQGLKTAF